MKYVAWYSAIPVRLLGAFHRTSDRSLSDSVVLNVCVATKWALESRGSVGNYMTYNPTLGSGDLRGSLYLELCPTNSSSLYRIGIPMEHTTRR